MNFIEAIKALKDGHRVTNSKLKSAGSYWYRVITKGENLPYASDSYDFFDDYLDESWELYEEEPKLHTFPEVINAYIVGSTIYRKSATDKKYRIRDSRVRNTFDDFDILSKDWIILYKEEKNTK